MTLKATSYFMNLTLTGNLTGLSATVKLFKNAGAIIDASMTTGNFTEADFSGYSGGQVLGALTGITTGDPSVATFPDNVETHNGGGVANDIYGYYVIGGGGQVLWAEADPAAPVPMASGGDTYTITPHYNRGNA